MSHYKETTEYTWINENHEIIQEALFSDWNSKTNIVTIWNKQGKVVYSGTDSEAKALGKLLMEKCTQISEIPNQN